jgi:hypothetical protein
MVKINHVLSVDCALPEDSHFQRKKYIKEIRNLRGFVGYLNFFSPYLLFLWRFRNIMEQALCCTTLLKIIYLSYLLFILPAIKFAIMKQSFCSIANKLLIFTPAFSFYGHILRHTIWFI